MAWFIQHGLHLILPMMTQLLNCKSFSILTFLPTDQSGFHIALIPFHWTSGYGELQKQTVFADKPTTLDNIKQSIAQNT